MSGSTRDLRQLVSELKELERRLIAGGGAKED